MKATARLLKVLLFTVVYCYWGPSFAEESEKAWNGWAGVGLGAPTKTYSLPSTGFEIGGEWPSPSNLDIGFFIGFTQAKRDQSVDFPLTGYTEKRAYDMNAYSTGARLSYKLSPLWALNVDAGLALMQSKLTKVTTTAPLPSSLEAGVQTQSGPYFTYAAALEHRYPMGHFAIGSSLGYSTINDDQGLSEVRFMVKVMYSPKPFPVATVNESESTSEDTDTVTDKE